MIAWDHWHIEPSSICSLRCPRCPRAEVPETLLNRQLDLSFFQNQIGSEIIKRIQKITFCGNDGDPIYCRDLVDICAWIKDHNPQIHLVIVTNGSHRSEKFWTDLARVLNHSDEIHWSIDGWDQHSNQQYRVNSDWESIQQGISVFGQHNQHTYKVWATIAFAFNEHHLEVMKNLAHSQGMDMFQLTKSTKFGAWYPNVYGHDDRLQPTQRNLMSSSHRFERQIHALTSKARPGDQLKTVFLQRAQDLRDKKQYAGLCLIGNKGVFVNSQGEFYPCCWTANRYIHNTSWHELARTKFNLKQRSFKDVIDDDFWRSSFLEFSSQECQTKCTAEKLHDPEHVSEW